MLTNILKKLITFKTVSTDKKENERALRWIKNYLKNLPVTIREYKFNGFPSLVVTTKNSKKAKVFLLAHVDVVAGSAQMFKAKISNGKMYGRGTFDMKFAIACFLQLFCELADDLKNYDLGLMITSDEEIGGFDGVGELVKMGFGADVCILPDGGENWTIQRSAKGVLRVLVESRGKSGHGSRPWVGVNAIEELADFLTRLRKKFPAEPCRDKNHFHDTMNVGVIHGGESVNQIPDFAQAFIDFRFTPKTSKAKLQRILREAKQDFPRINFKEDRFNAPYRIKTNDRFVKKYTNIFQSHTKQPPKFIDSHGSSDAKFFVPKGITTILTRPEGAGLHSEVEWIDLASMAKFYEILKEFVRETAK